MALKLILINNFNIYRQGLKLLIESNLDFEVVGEVLKPDQLPVMLKETNPDIIVWDLNCSPKSDISICDRLNPFCNNIPVVIITGDVLEYSLLEMVVNNAWGLLWKNSKPKELANAINNVASGRRYINIPDTKNIVREIQIEQNELDDNFTSFGLSKRELDVLSLFAKGLSYKQIGKSLNISPRTVESHKNNILTKLDLHSVPEMITFGIKHGIVEP